VTHKIAIHHNVQQLKKCAVVPDAMGTEEYKPRPGVVKHVRTGMFTLHIHMM